MSKPITDLQQWGKFLSNYNGKDKFARLIQYGSRGIRYYILSANPDSEVGKRFEKLYSTLSLNTCRSARTITTPQIVRIVSPPADSPEIAGSHYLLSGFFFPPTTAKGHEANKRK